MYSSFSESRHRNPEIAFTPQKDQEFRSSIRTHEMFLEQTKGRPVLEALATVVHEIDGTSILEHTRQVLMHLRTDTLSSVSLEGTTYSLPELMRMVSRYHDADKGLRPDARTPIPKDQAIEASISEIQATTPGFFRNETDIQVFCFFMKTCDYFGYHIGVLNQRGDAQRTSLMELIRKNIEEPLDELEAMGIEVDWEDALRIQYELSRADTMGIEPFRQNVGQIDRLFEELNKAFSY